MQNILVHNPKIIYVLEKTELAGGVKVVFEHVNRLNRLGIPTVIFSLQQSPSWFDCFSNVISFSDYAELGERLASTNAIKVATLWRTAPIVAQNSKENEGFYLVQDIEVYYYSDNNLKESVLSTYQLPLDKLVESKWVEKELVNMNQSCKNIGIGIDHSVFHPNPNITRQNNTILINAPRYLRHWHIKGMDTLEQVLQLLGKQLPNIKIVSFSPEPTSLSIPNLEIIHWAYPTDEEIATLYQRAGCFLITSLHEGFCLPALEAMACGCPVVITKADGNEEFCIDGKTCLLTNRNVQQIANAIAEILINQSLSRRLSSAGIHMAQNYQWDNVITTLVEAFGL